MVNNALDLKKTELNSIVRIIVSNVKFTINILNNRRRSISRKINNTLDLEKPELNKIINEIKPNRTLFINILTTWKRFIIKIINNTPDSTKTRLYIFIKPTVLKKYNIKILNNKTPGLIAIEQSITKPIIFNKKPSINIFIDLSGL